MRKEVEFLARVDTSEFDKAIEQIQRKVREAYRPGEQLAQQRATAQRLENIGLGGNMSKPSQDAMNRAMLNSRKEIDQLIAKEAKAQEQISKEMTAQLRNLNALKEAQKSAVGDVEKELALKKEIAAKEEAMYRNREEWAAKDSNLNQMIDARQRASRGGIGGAMDAYQSGGFRGLGSHLGVNGKGALALGVGALGTGLGFAAQINDRLANSGFRTKINTGNAIDNTIGSTINDMGTAYGQSWTSERAEAIKAARAKDANARLQDKLLVASGASIATGSAYSLLPGVATGGLGTLAGLGGVGVGLGMMFRGNRAPLSASAMATGTAWNIDHSPLGMATHGGFGASKWLRHQSDQQMQVYNAARANDFAKDFQDSFNAGQKENPLKRLAAQNYDSHWQQYLGSQRAMGLDYNSFHAAGGFRERALNANFTDQQGMAMGSSILGAGGSTDSAVNNSVFAMQMQRRGLTNAGSMMGMLSGSMGSSQMSEQAMVKILAEGNRVGLDSSKFAEENRRFTQTVADIVSNAGAKGNDVDAIARRFGSFMPDQTNKGIEAAKTAYEQYQRVSSETTGPRGVMRAAGMMRDKDLKNISTITKTALMQIPEAQFTEDNPTVREAAKEANLTVDQLREKMGNTTQNSMSRFKESDMAVARIKAFAKKKGLKGIPDNIGDLLDTASLKKDFDMIPTYGVAEGMSLTTAKDQNAFRMGRLKGSLSLDPQERLKQEAEQRKKTMSADTGRVEDQTNTNMAESGRLALDSFRTFHKEMIPTVELIKSFNAGVANAVVSMKQMSTSDQDKMAATLYKMLGIQNQSGKTGQ